MSLLYPLIAFNTSSVRRAKRYFRASFFFRPSWYSRDSTPFLFVISPQNLSPSLWD
jgi:hypothetical protein